MRTSQPENADLSYVSYGGSSANPVQGIVNATSGYLSVNDSNSNASLFYIFYSCRNLASGTYPQDVPTILWLQGGPGGSSLIGNFFEQGPWSLELNESTGSYQEVPRQYSWNDYFNMLYIDNPRGTGYSTVGSDGYDSDETEIANDFVNALINFYQLDPFQSYQTTPLYILGESYAGHYIPSIGVAIINYNGQNEFQIPLKGVGIGDGWTDPINQLVYNDLFAYSVGLVDDLEKAAVTSAQLAAVTNIKIQNWGLSINSFDVMLDTITTSGGGLNVYNFRDFGDYDFSDIETFMNDQNTCTRYNVDPSVCGTYQSENSNVYDALQSDFMKSVASDVATLLNNQLPVMIYNGQDDIICNSPNQQNWVGNLTWSGNSDFYSTPFQVWIYENGTIAGLAKQTESLTFVIVNKAGHLSPYDQINTTTEMVRRFVSGNTNWTNPLSYDLIEN